MLFVCTALGAAGCRKSPVEPDPAALVMSCPDPLAREATMPDGTDVHFLPPEPTGGLPPYAVECTPPSSSVFPVGDSTVSCRATDSVQQQATCTFRVTVQVSQTISRTRFLAFGDSITAGAISLSPMMMLTGPETYPFKLEQLLRERYPSQSFAVTNSGVGGEDTREGAERLPSALRETSPEVLLLLEGINHINELTVDRQADAIREMIDEAQDRNVEVIIATVMPVTSAFRQYRSTTLPKIRDLNERIFQLADRHGIGQVVDLFALFQSDLSLIGRDGLHPTAEGQTRIAEAFRDEIVRRYESRATMTSSAPLRPNRMTVAEPGRKP
jgi:lysophospholipase L1-like esterase